MFIVRLILVLSCVCVLQGCSNEPIVPPSPAPAMTENAPALQGKADLPWLSGTLANSWRDTMTCATAFGQGASDGARNLADGLWRLPGIVTQFLRDFGQEFLRRERDMIMALSDEEARQRVLETVGEDVEAIRAFFMHLRRAIPALWESLQNGPGWFGTLNRSEKVTFVCEVTGRIAFEILFMIAADKGVSKLASLARIRLVRGVQSQAMTLYQAGRLAYLTRRSILEVGESIAGIRKARQEDPDSYFGAIASIEVYERLIANGEEGRNNYAATPGLGLSETIESGVNLLIGAKQWARTAGNEWIDVLIPATQPSPEDSILARSNIGYETAIAILRTSESDQSLWPAAAKEVVVPGALFHRYYVPADRVFGPTEFHITVEIAKKLGKLSDLMGQSIDTAIQVCADFIDRSPLDRLSFLDDLIAIELDANREEDDLTWELDEAYAP